MSDGWLTRKTPKRLLFAPSKLLAERRPNDFLLIIGDGPQREKLRRLQMKNTGVKWMQYCTDSSELARFYRAADLFVHPGVQETFGLVALESQACGTPVIGIRGSSMDHGSFFTNRNRGPRKTVRRRWPMRSKPAAKDIEEPRRERGESGGRALFLAASF